MRFSYLIVFASLVFSLHCEGPAAETRDLPTPLHTLSALGKDVRPKQRSFSLSSGKAPTLSVSTDEERFRLVLRANGWFDFSRHIEKLRELQITDVKAIEIDLPLSACGFALPTSDARIHRCYYVEKSTNERPAEIRFVLGNQTVITWSDAVAGKILFVSEGLALVSTEEVTRAGEPTKSRLFALRLDVVVSDPTQPAIGFELPLHFNYGELPR